MRKELDSITRQIDSVLAEWDGAWPAAALSGLIQAQIELRRLIARSEPETRSTGFVEAFTATLVELEQARSCWPDLLPSEPIDVTTAYRLGCRRGISYGLVALEPLYERLQESEAHRG